MRRGYESRTRKTNRKSVHTLLAGGQDTQGTMGQNTFCPSGFINRRESGRAILEGARGGARHGPAGWEEFIMDNTERGSI